MDREMKFSILSEGQTDSVASVCRKYGISRTIYYRWLNRYKSRGIAGLEDTKRAYTPPNKTSEYVEADLLELFKTYPTYGPKALKYLMEEMGHDIGESAVFNVMKRHNLTNRKSRINYAGKQSKSPQTSAVSETALLSEATWVAWITDYGSFRSTGPVFEYTIMDIGSRIASSRLYSDVDTNHFIRLLNAVALPVAQSLNLDLRHLCFLEDRVIQAKITRKTLSLVQDILEENGFEMKLHRFPPDRSPAFIDERRNHFTDTMLTDLLPKLQSGLDMTDLRKVYQKQLRAYNTEKTILIGQDDLAPVDHYTKRTGNEFVLPIWAYMERDY